MVPAKDFELSKRFYTDMGFQPREIADGLVEMNAGPYSFLLQNYYVKDWADNFVIHMAVSDLNLWWERIVSLDLASRYGVRTGPPKQEDWGLVFGIIDPSGVLWRISESRD
jgi:hypothetical protein